MIRVSLLVSAAYFLLIIHKVGCWFFLILLLLCDVMRCE